jgi:hypothetical protein
LFAVFYCVEVNYINYPLKSLLSFLNDYFNMKKANFFALVAIFTLVFSAIAYADTFDVDLTNLEVLDSSVCQGDAVTARVKVKVECTEEAMLSWYVDDELVEKGIVDFFDDESETVDMTINTNGLSPGSHVLKVSARTACCERDSETLRFEIEEPEELHEFDLGSPELSFSEIYKGCCGDGLEIMTTVSSEDFGGIDTFGLRLNLYVYDNPSRTGGYVYRDSRDVMMGSNAERTVVFPFNPSYMSAGTYYVFVEATEREDVCGESFSDWSGYAKFVISCDDCALDYVAVETDSGDGSGSATTKAGIPTLGTPSLATVVIYSLLAAIGIVSTLIIVKLTQGISSAKSPM